MGYKWALGPMGSGFLYARRDSQRQLRPIIGANGVSWQDVAAGRPDQASGATRFEFASRAWPEAFALGKSLEFLAAVGISEVQGYVLPLVAYLRSRLSRIDGVQIHTPAPPEPSTGIVAFSLAGIAPRKLSQALRERWQIVQRAAMMVGPEGGVRISLALYTSEQEVDRLIDAVTQLARERELG
jgi:selenocysteine lyase/cysteine desulfurase